MTELGLNKKGKKVWMIITNLRRGESCEDKFVRHRKEVTILEAKDECSIKAPIPIRS